MLGRFRDDGTIRLQQREGVVTDILAEDDDITTVAFTNPVNTTAEIESRLLQSPQAEVFFVLEIDTVQSGNNVGFPLAFVFVDFGQTGTSYLSTDGAAPVPVDLTWAMQLNYVDGSAVP